MDTGQCRRSVCVALATRPGSHHRALQPKHSRGHSFKAQQGTRALKHSKGRMLRALQPKHSRGHSLKASSQTKAQQGIDGTAASAQHGI
eukprot:1157024-Pelagomonas_calceolata.AAC.7